MTFSSVSIFCPVLREKRYIREIIYGKRQDRQYWEITKDKENADPENSWYFMTKIANLKYDDVGNIYKIRSGIEHGFRNSKSELGWADFRVTNYSSFITLGKTYDFASLQTFQLLARMA